MKAKFIVALAAIVLFSSCSKESGIINTNEDYVNSNQKTINEVVSIPSNQARKIAYNLLTVDNKVEIWKQHMKNYINENPLSNFQKTLVENFISVITPEIFISRENAQTFIAKKEIAELIYISKKAFTINQIYNIFGDLGNQTNSLEEEGGGNGCTCYTGSSFCSGQTSCYGNMWNCTTSNTGCGWFLLEACNGRCGGGV